MLSGDLLQAQVRYESAGAALLNEVEQFLGRFVAYPSEYARIAHALWCAHAHLMPCWETTPRIAFLSPEPASGKTRALEITELLVPRPISAVNMSSSALFRKVADDEGLPTILFDEIDTIFGPKAREHEELRGLLNAGHRRGAKTYRTVISGTRPHVEEIEAFSAVALAGLGDLPDTLLSRSVVVRMQRRKPDEHVESFRRRLHAAEGERLRDSLAEWAAGIAVDIASYIPEMPEGVADRSADCWEALLAVADRAGGDWPERARVSAVSLVSLSRDNGESLGLKLLHDLYAVFGSGKISALSTSQILEALNNMDESPWGDLRGRPLDSRGLARLLKKYGVGPTQIRIGDVTLKGYRAVDLCDVWRRYVPVLAEKSETNETSETSVTDRADADSDESILESEKDTDPLEKDTTCVSCDGAGCKWCAVRELPF